MIKVNLYQHCQGPPLSRTEKDQSNEIQLTNN